LTHGAYRWIGWFAVKLSRLRPNLTLSRPPSPTFRAHLELGSFRRSAGCGSEHCDYEENEEADNSGTDCCLPDGLT
jgi:hypothetical protein